MVVVVDIERMDTVIRRERLILVDVDIDVVVAAAVGVVAAAPVGLSVLHPYGIGHQQDNGLSKFEIVPQKPPSHVFLSNLHISSKESPRLVRPRLLRLLLTMRDRDDHSSPRPMMTMIAMLKNEHETL